MLEKRSKIGVYASELPETKEQRTNELEALAKIIKIMQEKNITWSEVLGVLELST